VITWLLGRRARDETSNLFNSLANDTLEKVAKRFTEQNQINITQVLQPLKTQLQDFENRVNVVHVEEVKDHGMLREHLSRLMELNRSLAKEADDLVEALKGSNKVQGTWGEFVLSRVLEMAGLRKGIEYDEKETHTTEEGKRLQPDVVIHLPGDRHLVIDSKVSLIAYLGSVAAKDDVEREKAITDHLTSIRSHLKALSTKNYEALYGLKSTDFVLMFMPIEPAFALAISREPGLLMEAWKKNVLLVNPSTLVFVLRIVAHLWTQDKLRNNYQEIATRGAELFNRLSGFVSELVQVGTKVDQAQQSYRAAYKKLCEGKGNVIWQAEQLKQLGVNPAKEMPSTPNTIGASGGDGELVPALSETLERLPADLSSH
jgi:DNA recombination protein RmuC